ncbi:NAD(P)-binding protein [Calocera viscosa TUFC12733]|uniref:NAD(P)-binding protein n=1 Tax=Calocera viscosa (strain TUFC12733) TaxID=1330018 RepID=A0A167R8Z7_CALVF|nr:NAD(P)-binding protein [Calocera viscosa TUFC12733]
MAGLISHQFYTGAVMYFVLSTALLYLLFTAGENRPNEVKKREERVLVLGGSSGIGKAIAIHYAKRGAKICIVARREEGMEEVKQRCLRLLAKRAPRSVKGKEKEETEIEQEGKDVLVMTGDIASVEDMVRVRKAVNDAWGGLDTLVLSAGISSLQPLMYNAGWEKGNTDDPTEQGLAHLQEIVRKVSEVNYVASALVAATFFPMLERTSKQGAVMLISSAAALIPAPTRTLYGSSKAASLALYQALAIEHPSLRFSLICPGTVNTSFRSSAPDGDDKREVEESKLEPDVVAERAVQAVDSGERMVVMPFKFSLGHWLYILGGRKWIEREAAKKYNWTR